MQENEETEDTFTSDTIEFFLHDLTKDERLRFICLKLALDYKMGQNAVSDAYKLYNFITNTPVVYKEK